MRDNEVGNGPIPSTFSGAVAPETVASRILTLLFEADLISEVGVYGDETREDGFTRRQAVKYLCDVEGGDELHGYFVDVICSAASDPEHALVDLPDREGKDVFLQIEGPRWSLRVSAAHPAAGIPEDITEQLLEALPDGDVLFARPVPVPVEQERPFETVEKLQLHLERDGCRVKRAAGHNDREALNEYLAEALDLDAYGVLRVEREGLQPVLLFVLIDHFWQVDAAWWLESMAGWSADAGKAVVARNGWALRITAEDGATVAPGQLAEWAAWLSASVHALAASPQSVIGWLESGQPDTQQLTIGEDRAPASGERETAPQRPAPPARLPTGLEQFTAAGLRWWLGQLQLPTPYIPGELAGSLRWEGLGDAGNLELLQLLRLTTDPDACADIIKRNAESLSEHFSTPGRSIEAELPGRGAETNSFQYYMFEGLSETLDGDWAPRLVIDHAGHGLNSYAYTYELVVDQLVFFAQVPGRGVFDHPSGSKFGWALIADLAERLHKVVLASDELARGERLVVAWSGFRGITAAGVVSVHAAVGEAAFLGECDLDAPQEQLTHTAAQARAHLAGALAAENQFQREVRLTRSEP